MGSSGSYKEEEEINDITEDEEESMKRYVEIVLEICNRLNGRCPSDTIVSMIL
jgi:hypothetical protein